MTIKVRQAPVRGLMLRRTTAPDPLGAEVLDNWFPSQEGVRVRGGRRRDATLPSDVTALLVYDVPDAPRLFAATATGIHDVTGFPTTPPSVLSGQAGGAWAGQQIATAGGAFLVAANGADAVQVFDGTSFSAATLTFSPTGPSSSDLALPWLYRNRLFFVQGDTMRAWFLPVGAIQGELRDVSLGGVFQRGGALMFGATWSLDAGDGIDDKCVFVSTNGEVAVYEGADPASIEDWRLVGRYEVGRPVGPQAYMRAGGDLLILTESGAISLAAALKSDPSALDQTSISRAVEPLWKAEAARRAAPWCIVKWDSRSLALVIIPGASQDRTLAVHLDTGAWGAATNWSLSCGAIYRGAAYGAVGDGVFALDASGQDDGKPFVAAACLSFAEEDGGATDKVARLMRGVFRASIDPAARFGVAADYQAIFPSPPARAATPLGADSAWDGMVWGQDAWAGSEALPTETVTTRWTTVRGQGLALAPTVQIRSDSVAALAVELVRIDMKVETGGVVA